MRVMIVEPSGLLWGSERALLDLLEHLPSGRYELSVACPIGAPLADIMRTRQIRVIEGPIGMLHHRGRAARARALVWLARLMRREEPDVVHVNQAGVTRLVTAARLPFRTPVISHVRLWEDAVMLKSLFNGPFSPTVCVAISSFIESELANDRDRGATETDASHHSVELIYDPFDTDAFAAEIPTDAAVGVRNELGLPSERKLVLLAGRICEEKGQDLFFEAAEILAAPNVSYLVAGGVAPESVSDDAFHSELIDRADRSRVRDDFIFLGNRTDVARLMKASDLVVLASRNEPFGRVLLEALSLGVPVVGPQRGGPTEIIGHSERGFLFETGDAGSLAAAIASALDDPAIARGRAERGRMWVADVCAPYKHSERIQSVWNRAAGWNQAPGGHITPP